MKEDYEALQMEHSQLKAAYLELKEGTNDQTEVEKVSEQGLGVSQD